MTEIIGVRFKNAGKTYFFSPGGQKLSPGDRVIVETARGIECGSVAIPNRLIDDGQIIAPLKGIIRRADEQDLQVVEENARKEKEAFKVCQQRIAARGLEMHLVDVEYTFDGNKILFYFTADGRVDFRELVKDLAGVFRTRIELRQIGVRDESKMLGGLGICGRPFCCSTFLGDFQPVSIKMAKEQSLSLNPTKISGTCGRLMCCLKYEQEAYEDLLKTSPKNESFVDTVDGRGTIVDVNLLKQTVRVRMEDEPDTINTYKNTEIVVLRSGKAKKTDPPIPKDLAPLSSLPKPLRRVEEVAETLPEVMFRGQPLTSEQPRSEAPEKPEESPNRSRRRRRKPAEKQEGAAKPQQKQEGAAKPQQKQEGAARPQQKQEKPTQQKQERPERENQPREKKPRPEGAEASAASDAPRHRRRRRPRGKGGEGKPQAE